MTKKERDVYNAALDLLALLGREIVAKKSSSAGSACSIAPWVSVKDALPDTGFAPDWASSMEVIAWTTECVDREDAIFAYYHETGAWISDHFTDETEKVTHWMYKPDPPKQ